jgi:FMN phosphatase YigB (HAD superfamily)
MPFETIFLDAGVTLVWPNWERVSETLRVHGIQVDAAALAAADPFVRRSLDEPHLIAAATDQRRGRNYFESILARAGVALTPAAQRALSRLEEYQRTMNLWESVPAFVAPTLAELRRRGYRLVVVSNANGTVRRAFQRIGLFELVDMQRPTAIASRRSRSFRACFSSFDMACHAEVRSRSTERAGRDAIQACPERWHRA